MGKGVLITRKRDNAEFQPTDKDFEELTEQLEIYGYITFEDLVSHKKHFLSQDQIAEMEEID